MCWEPCEAVTSVGVSEASAGPGPSAAAPLSSSPCSWRSDRRSAGTTHLQRATGSAPTWSSSSSPQQLDHLILEELLQLQNVHLPVLARKAAVLTDELQSEVFVGTRFFGMFVEEHDGAADPAVLQGFLADVGKLRQKDAE